MNSKLLNAKTQRRKGAKDLFLCISAPLRLCVKNVSLAFFFCLLAVLPATAQAPERREAFLWATTVFAGVQYESTFTPPENETIYLVADESHVLAPRSTLVYDWPITNRLRADWLARNELVEGALVLRNSAGQEERLALTGFWQAAPGLAVLAAHIPSV